MKKLIVLSKYVLAFLSLLAIHHIFSYSSSLNINYAFVFTPMMVMQIAKLGMTAFSTMEAKNQEVINKASRAATLKKQEAEIDKIYNPLAAAKTSDRGEQLALDQGKDIMSGLTNNLYSAEQTAQATNLVRAQQKQALQVGAQLSQKEDATNITRLQGEKDTMMTKANMSTDLNFDALAKNEAERQDIEARKMINREAAITAVGGMAEQAVKGSALYSGMNYEDWKAGQDKSADTSRDSFRVYKRGLMDTSSQSSGGSDDYQAFLEWKDSQK